MALTKRLRLLCRVGLVVVLIGISVGAWVWHRNDVGDVETGASIDCLPWTRPRDVAGINKQIADVRALPGFAGADVGADARLQDGRSLWVFGDTLRAEGFQGQRFVRNSMLLFSPGCATAVIPEDHGAIIPDRDDGVGYWPMSVGVDHHELYDIVGVGAQRVRTTGKGAYDFEILGPAMATYVVPIDRAPQLLEVTDFGPDIASRKNVMWGAAITVKDNLLYVYGTSNPEEKYVFGWALHVARVPLSTVSNLDRWEYWDGRRWQRDKTKADAVIPAQGGVSEVLSVFERDGSWYAVSKRDEFLGTDLVIWKAPTPVGPFVASEPLAKIPSSNIDGTLRYMPLAHPDLLTKPGSVLVSYSRNVVDFDKLLKDPKLYRPTFLEVPLP